MTDFVPRVMYTNGKVIFLESTVALLVFWALLAHGLALTDTISSPTLVFASLVELLLSGDWVVHMADTMRRVIYGFVLTTIIGTVLGVVMGMSDFWENALQDYITIGLALPSLFAAIFAAMWFGLSDVTPMVAAAAIAFPFLTQNVYEGVKNVNYELMEMSSAFDVSRNRAIRRVIFQSVLPEWFAGARYSFAICWKITTLAELVAASSGIGYMIEFQMHKLSITGVLTWTVLFTMVILFVEYGILQQIEKRVFAWRQSTEIGIMGGA
ncbi:ABC transporter permease [Halogeometricum limi]|nr:ABC transporter permease subunit [Halogeometricum limi]